MLRSDLAVFEHTDADDGRLVVLKDPIAERFFRITPFEHQFLRLFDGTRTLAEATAAFRERGFILSDRDARQVAERAGQMGLLLRTGYSTALYQSSVRHLVEDAHKKHFLAQIYFCFIPMINPDRFLERTLWVYRLVANRWSAMLMAILTPGAMMLAVAGSERLSRQYLFFFSWQGVLYLWLTLTCAKIIHELAHGYTAKGYGLRVPRMGMAFLVFVPYLYCDTTDAWQLPRRRQRLAVSAAGILVEICMAVLATYVWYFTRPGIINSLAFHLVAVSLLATALVNANPLIKRDGYFMLIDVLDMPNLASKSATHVRYLFQNRVLGMVRAEPCASSPYEALVFLGYGVLSLLYRVFIYVSIVAIVYYKFDKILGVALAGMAIVLFIITPSIGGIVMLIQRRREIRPRLAGSFVMGTIALALIAILVFPMQTQSIYPCEVIPARTQQLSLPLQAPVKTVFIRQGTRVDRGARLFQLDASLLELDLTKTRLERDIARKEYDAALVDSQELGHVQEKRFHLLQLEDLVAQASEKVDMAQRQIVAPFAGVVASLHPMMQPGFQPGEGVVVGEMESVEPFLVRALVPGRDRARVAIGQDVSVLLPIGNGATLHGRITQFRSYSVKDLRNSPFASTVGGELAIEPKDPEHRETPLEDQFACTVALSGERSGMRSGMTGRMAVPSPPRSLLARMIDAVFHIFNRESVS